MQCIGNMARALSWCVGRTSDSFAKNEPDSVSLLQGVGRCYPCVSVGLCGQLLFCGIGTISDMGSVVKSSKPIGRILDDVARSSRVMSRDVSAKIGELKEPLSWVFVMLRQGDRCQGESDTVKMLLSGTEIRFWAEHGALLRRSTPTPRRRNPE